jgi:hypothetical protein
LTARKILCYEIAMNWNKYWLETRWFFLVMLGTLIVGSAIIVLGKPYDPDWWMASQRRPGEHSGGTLSEPLEVLSTYQGYIWARWFRDELLTTWPLFAAGLGIISLKSARFMVNGSRHDSASAYPTRRKLAAGAAITGAAEASLISIVPSLLLPVFARLSGHTYPVADALIFAALMASGGMVFYMLSFLLTALLRSGWKALVAVWSLHLILRPHQVMADFPWWSGIYRTMSGQSYLTAGELPWVGLSVSLAISIALFYLSLQVFEARRQQPTATEEITTTRDT